MSKTIKCPHCGSSRTAYWTEECRTLHYKIDKNGERHLNPFHKSKHYTLDGTFGYMCLDCKKYVNLNEEEAEKWEVV